MVAPVSGNGRGFGAVSGLPSGSASGSGFAGSGSAKTLSGASPASSRSN